ncbi:MAG: MarR family transcriptional regulator [Tidjanibacter sp.]|nr:MarR family transcriptional regulator [Tidjanibacter sp.]
MIPELLLQNQLCFPLYACAKEIVRAYTPFLSPLGLTYTQYLAMMVLWEHKCIGVKEIGQLLMLDSGTLSPMLKSMERSGWLTRERSREDERRVYIAITPAGEKLQERTAEVPRQVAQCLRLESEDAMQLYALLTKMMEQFRSTTCDK